MGTSGSPILAYTVAHWISFRIFFGNVVFLQTLLVPPFGSDSPAWSLACEFWYYVLFPCLVISLTAGFSWLRRSVAAICMIAVAVFIGTWMLGGFLIWLMGAAIVLLPRLYRLKDRYYYLLLTGSFLFVGVQLVLTYAPGKIEGAMGTDYMLAILFSILLYSLLHYPRPVRRQYKWIAKQTAGFSYTLYLTHMPILTFFSAWLNDRSQPTAKHFLIPTAILCLTVAYAYLIAMLFEHNTDRVRKRLEAVFGLRYAKVQ